MKNAIVIMMIILAANEAAALRWEDGEIRVIIDSSVEEIGDGVYEVIEDAFLEWNDAIPADIRLDFVRGECAAIYGVNCVTMVDTSLGYLTHTQQTSREGIISDSDILINRAFEYRTSDNEHGYDLRRLMLHEVGHFFAGLPHSDDPTDVMYGYGEYNGLSANLNDQNRADVAAAYADTNETGCSMAPKRGVASIFNLFF